MAFGARKSSGVSNGFTQTSSSLPASFNCRSVLFRGCHYTFGRGFPASVQPEYDTTNRARGSARGKSNNGLVHRQKVQVFLEEKPPWSFVPLREGDLF